MQRSNLTWLAFAICVGLLIAAMGWLSRSALRLEAVEQRAARQSENERLALWRLDSAVLPLIAQENSRPFPTYRAFYLPEHAYSRFYAPIKVGMVQVPSPLLAFESQHVRLHFELGADGVIQSPQVPSGNMRDLAEAKYVEHDHIVSKEDILGELRETVTLEQIEALFAMEPDDDDVSSARKVVELNEQLDAFNQPDVQTANPFQQQAVGFQQQKQVEQQTRSAVEFHRRNSVWMSSNNTDVSGFDPVKQTGMRAIWIARQLFLIRRVTINDDSIFQGCLLDWPAMEKWLVSEIKDLLPDAKLQPLAEQFRNTQPLTMASMPVKLLPGRAPFAVVSNTTPLRFSIYVAWAGLILATIAVAAMLWAAFRLSERRGAFVSAVTHELRTPLTTFQLYTEMLADGRLTDETKRSRYIDTLRAEADRLSHLVENVLSFARLERTHVAGSVDDFTLNDLFAQLDRSLTLRADHAEMKLEVSCTDDVAVRANRGAVERIVFNLVDNACKYGGSDDVSEIHVSWQANGSSVDLCVRDFGDGVSDEDRKRLFKPFSKSANEAAHSAPGVGLGLALCRRLARSMGGDLRLDASISPGACFVISLPMAANAPAV